ncbi:MAG: hypothetical protein AAFR46_02400 [Pseudomonadota bacterium]
MAASERVMIGSKILGRSFVLFMHDWRADALGDVVKIAMELVDELGVVPWRFSGQYKEKRFDKSFKYFKNFFARNLHDIEKLYFQTERREEYIQRMVEFEFLYDPDTKYHSQDNSIFVGISEENVESEIKLASRIFMAFSECVDFGYGYAGLLPRGFGALSMRNAMSMGHTANPDQVTQDIMTHRIKAWRDRAKRGIPTSIDGFHRDLFDVIVLGRAHLEKRLTDGTRFEQRFLGGRFGEDVALPGGRLMWTLDKSKIASLRHDMEMEGLFCYQYRPESWQSIH